MSYGETIGHIRPGEETGEYDSQENPVLADETETQTSGWAVEPIMAAESAEPFAQQIIVGYRLYKRGVIEEFSPADKARVRGTVWAVAGQLGDWENPSSKWRGTVVNVKAVI